MEPDNDEPAGLNEGDENIKPPRVPRSPDLPPPPDIQFSRPLPERNKFSANPDVKTVTSTSDQKPKADLGAIGKAGAGLSSGLMFASNVIVAILIGMYIDQHWPKLAPWGLLVFSLAGIASGFLTLFRLLSVHDEHRKQK